MLTHTRLLVHPVLERIGRTPDTQGAGQQYRRLDLAELAHLRLADQLAVAIADMDPGRYRMRVQITGARDNRRDARTDVIPLDAGRVPDPHVLDVADCVKRARFEGADDQPNVASPRPFIAPGHGTRVEKETEKEHED